MSVELRHLRTFLAVAETSNFTRAADLLHIAQPSLSSTIRQLEGHLDVRLFDRTTRSTALTPEGEVFLEEARAVVARFDEAMGRMERVGRGEAGFLRVGYLIGAAVDFVPQILREFNEHHPEVVLEVTEYDFGHPDVGLGSGETDVAIVRLPLDEDVRAESETLFREASVACVPESHPLAGSESVTLAQLLAEPIVAAPGVGAWRDYWILSRHRTEPANVTYEAPTFESELQAVAFGHGLSVVPKSATEYYRRPGVRFIDITGLEPSEVAVAWRDSSSATTANFRRVAHRVARSWRIKRQSEEPAGRSGALERP